MDDNTVILGKADKGKVEPYISTMAKYTEEAFETALAQTDVREEIENLKDFWEGREMPKITTNRVSEEYRKFCKQQYDFWKGLDDSPKDKDLAMAISRSVGTNVARYKRKLTALEDTHARIFDRYLLGDNDWIIEHCGEEILEEMREHKEHPQGIFIDLVAYNEMFHVTNYVKD